MVFDLAATRPPEDASNVELCLLTLKHSRFRTVLSARPFTFSRMRKIWLSLMAVFAATIAFSQQPFRVKGVVIDTAGLPLTGANIRLIHGSDSAFAVTNKSGLFSFDHVTSASFSITASYTGLRTVNQAYARRTDTAIVELDPIVLISTDGILDSVVIRSIRPVIVKEDTIQYDASAYKVRDGAPVEDVIKKLPGVTVDKDGNVEAQGKKVARVRVNGKDFFGGDVQTATQNIPAELIQNIQIIDDYGDQANVSGIKTGDPEKILNINFQPNRNRGTFGNATAAGGTDGRYAGNLFLNNFKDERQLSVLGAINNTNANLFNFNGGGRGGGARGANFGSDGRAGAGGAGITVSKSIGINLRDKWGKKLSVYGSYSFSTRQTDINSLTFTQDINPQNIRTTQRQSVSGSSNFNHRFTWNMEYAMDSLNYFKLSPYVSYNQSNTQSVSQSEVRAMSRHSYTLSNNQSATNGSSPNAGGNFLFNHRFKRRGRNFSANANLDVSDSRNDRFTNSDYHTVDSFRSVTKDTVQIQSINTESRNTRTNVHLSYTEPLTASGTMSLEMNYDWNKSITESDRDVTDFQTASAKEGRYNDKQSNHYRYNFITNRAGISLRGRYEKYNYSVGLLSQPTSLKGYSLGKNFSTDYSNVNWIPSARFVYNFSRSNTLTATLDGNAREPSFFQLQPVADSSNLNNIVIGNPNLGNELTNTFSVRYNKFDPKAGSSLFANFSYDRTDNRIVNSVTYDSSGTRRTTTYRNTDGFYGYNANASFTKPFHNRRYTAGASLFANYDNNISYTDGYRNQGNNWNIRPGLNFRFDWEERADVTLRGDYTIYQTSTNYATHTTTTKAQTLNLGVNGKNYFGDLTVGYDFSKLINYGFAGGVASNPSILNVYAEYRFLKGRMMTVRLQGFDLLNENTGITRTVNGTAITDSRTDRLARYFLLSVNMRLAKFAGMRGGGNRQRGQGGQRGGGSGGGGSRGRTNF